MSSSGDRLSLEAFEQLLARPDPSDLPRRGHLLRYAGDPDRRATLLPAIMMAWLQQRHLRVDGGEPLVAPRPERAIAPVAATDSDRHGFGFALMMSRFTTH